MNRSILIPCTDEDGRYADVMDVAEWLARKYSSKANAIAQLVRESPEYKTALTASKAAKRTKPANG